MSRCFSFYFIPINIKVTSKVGFSFLIYEWVPRFKAFNELTHITQLMRDRFSPKPIQAFVYSILGTALSGHCLLGAPGGQPWAGLCLFGLSYWGIEPESLFVVSVVGVPLWAIHHCLDVLSVIWLWCLGWSYILFCVLIAYSLYFLTYYPCTHWQNPHENHYRMFLGVCVVWFAWSCPCSWTL